MHARLQVSVGSPRPESIDVIVTALERPVMPRRGTSGTGWTADRLRGGHVPASPSAGHPHGDRADSDARIVAMLLIADRGRRLDATRAQSPRYA